jgi:hypothetical protein
MKAVKVVTFFRTATSFFAIQCENAVKTSATRPYPFTSFTKPALDIPIRRLIDSDYIFAGSPANTATWLHLPSAEWISASFTGRQPGYLRTGQATDYTDSRKASHRLHRSKRRKSRRLHGLGADPEEHLRFREVNGARRESFVYLTPSNLGSLLCNL